MRTILIDSIAPLVLATVLATPSASVGQEPKTEIPPEDFLSLLTAPTESRGAQIEKIAEAWQPGHAPMLLEVLRFSGDAATNRAVIEALQRQTGKKLGGDLDAWYDWIWSRPDATPSRYPEFKSLLYRNIDARFGAYFDNDRATTIRLDEVLWGGVTQDGIPPLHQPRMLEASEATYLDDRDIVFGIEINGDSRAYPKRILAWHEMFTDTVAGVAVAGVYCTLCGSAVLYETELDGVQHALGTSGFLYRSNKLMFDHATQSLWNTLWGRPVVGPLVGQDIQLLTRPIVTSRWGEWRKRHPETTVLSLDTGHERDYSEGAAYRAYFSTDELMFQVPKKDKRLDNKAEVLALTNAGRSHALAIAQAFLVENPLYHLRFGDIRLVILTDGSGANRVYRTEGLEFSSWDQDRSVIDEKGVVWSLTEDALVGPERRSLPRFAAHRAFWFGWHAAYPETELIR